MQIRHLQPAGIAADHPSHHHRQWLSPPRHQLAENLLRRAAIKAGNTGLRLQAIDTDALFVTPGAQVGGTPVNRDKAVTHVMSFRRLVELAIIASAACSAASGS
ncbi:hypothetical protein D3C80_1752860 [compost metagenome]